MFGFIKKWLKPKSFKEVKQEYKQTKANWITRVEDIKGLENTYKAAEIQSEIMNLCFGALRPDQEDCPPLIIHNYKKLLEIADDINVPEYVKSLSVVNNLLLFIIKSSALVTAFKLLISKFCLFPSRNIILHPSGIFP